MIQSYEGQQIRGKLKKDAEFKRMKLGNKMVMKFTKIKSQQIK